MDQATKDVANNGEDMHPPNSPKLLLSPTLGDWKDAMRRECEMTLAQSGK
jgi:hypothetical protein